jgi:alpha-tubulin suppressor-like RCC1 family protein
MRGGDDTNNGQSLAILSDGNIYGWGNDNWGQLGNGSTTNSDVPVEATNMPTGVTFTYVASGGAQSLALDSNGNVWAWGNAGAGAVGNGSSSGSVLTPVTVLTGADMISATATNSIAHQPAL